MGSSISAIRDREAQEQWGKKHTEKEEAGKSALEKLSKDPYKYMHTVEELAQTIIKMRDYYVGSTGGLLMSKIVDIVETLKGK